MEITKDLIEFINEGIEDLGYFVEKTLVKKNNASLDGLIVKRVGDTNMVCPTIYPNDFEKFEDVLEYIHQVINKPSPKIEVEHIMEKNYILSNVRAQVVSAGNVMLEADVVYRDFLDMAIVYRVDIGEVDGGRASYLVKSGVLDKVGLTEEDLFEVVSKDMRFVTSTMAQTLAKLMGVEEVPEEMDLLDDIYIISNEQMINGAGVLCSDYLKDLREKFGCDLFILPSSLHEIIVLKERDGMVPTELLELVKQVNATEVRPADMLTDSVYKFDESGLSKVA